MIEKLQGHLKSPDFFDVARFPKATFVSTAIAAGGSGAPYTVSGNLTIHGVTKPISFPAQISVAGNTVTAAATFNVNRRDFGLNYPGSRTISSRTMSKSGSRCAPTSSSRHGLGTGRSCGAASHSSARRQPIRDAAPVTRAMWPGGGPPRSSSTSVWNVHLSMRSSMRAHDSGRQ